jgi:hypothetical protein
VRAASDDAARTPLDLAGTADRPIEALAWSGDGTHVAVAVGGGYGSEPGPKIRICAAESGKASQTLDAAAHVLGWGKAYLLADSVLYDPISGRRLRELSLPKGASQLSAAADASALAAAAGGDAYERPMKGGGREWVIPPVAIHQIDVASGKSRRIADGLQFSGLRMLNGDKLAVMTTYELILFVGGKPSRRLKTGANHWAVSEDGRWFVARDGSYHVSVSDLQTGRERARYGRAGAVESFVFLPGKQIVLAGSQEPSGGIWRWSFGSASR